MHLQGWLGGSYAEIWKKSRSGTYIYTGEKMGAYRGLTPLYVAPARMGEYVTQDASP